MASGLMDIMDLIYGFQKFQVLYSCTSLGIFEELDHHSLGPMSPDTLAARLALDQASLHRLLNAAVSLKLLQKHTSGPKQPVFYSNTKTVENFLVKSRPGSLRALVNKMGDLYSIWGSLSDSIREGYSPMPMALSFTPNNDIDETEQPIIKANHGLYSSQAKQLEFMQVMHMFSGCDAKQVSQAFDLSEFSTACDLGGGTGAIGTVLAEHNPHLHVTVFDLPNVIASANHFVTDKPYNLHFQSGDFFKDSLPSADLYILSHVIHDWGVEDIDVLLQKVYTALPKGGALLILEKCLEESKTSPFQTVFFDIGMLLLSEGKERTAQEYRALLKKHKFSNILVKILPKAMYRDSILAYKE